MDGGAFMINNYFSSGKLSVSSLPFGDMIYGPRDSKLSEICNWVHVKQ